MSSYLWKYYLEDDVERFQHLLETATYHVRGSARKSGGQGANATLGTSPGHHGGASPLLGAKGRKVSGQGVASSSGQGSVSLTRSDVNWRDANGMTILHHAASVVSDNAVAFAQALINHPLVDLYLQDLESGWTALHRAFYAGNITVARAILERDAHNAFGQTVGGRTHSVLGLIKIKDREGLGPLDLYAATIQDRTLHPAGRARADSNADSEPDMTEHEETYSIRRHAVEVQDVSGDECFTFGSNRNVTLGFGDEDDRQWPERISLRRPEHLLQRFYRDHMDKVERAASLADSTCLDNPTSMPQLQMPWVVRSRPIKIQDVSMSKLHTAVLTDDPESNLHVCGHGPGGRLGLGHEKTQYSFACVEGGALGGIKVAAVALGQNHTIAISDDGQIFSWGSNAYGQLGYTLPRNGLTDEDTVQTLPRQIFGPLKRENVQGIAASRTHSVAYTGSSLFTWGKNDGHLGLVDSDARSLQVQVTPRRVAASLFSTAISAVSASDSATICLLTGSNDCWVFANYGYAKIAFHPLNTRFQLSESRYLEQAEIWGNNEVVKITSGGDSICAMTSGGEVFCITVNQPPAGGQSSGSTTNPAKIKASLGRPQRIWTLRKNNMAARDVGVDADGSIIIATDEGSVWKRSRRAKIKDAAVGTSVEFKPKDYKFSRISGLTRVIAVRASAHGAYAAIRRDCDVTRTQIAVEPQQLWKSMLPLLSFAQFQDLAATPDSEKSNPEPRFWRNKSHDEVSQLKKQLLQAKDLEKGMKDFLVSRLADPIAGYDVVLRSSVSELAIPVHSCILGARSRFLRDRLPALMRDAATTDFDFMRFEAGDSLPSVIFPGIDAFTLINLALYCYTDEVIDYWHLASRAPNMAHRYRTIRTELMKLCAHLGLKKLEASVRQMITAPKSLNEDFEVAFQDEAFFDNANVLIELADDEVAVHSSILCQRCPFFQGMFMGRAGGRWLTERRKASDHDQGEMIRVDLKHVEARIFNLVLRHIYADTGEELFDLVVTSDLEEFFDLLMEVLSVANELMLDRLAQICQKVMGKHVDIRNVCSLLNAVAPSAVSEFKDAALEYMCLNLEAMLHGGFLDELDEDLLLDLDERVRSNQRDCMPFFRSGRAEALLLEAHPELVEIMARNRQAKIDTVMLRTKHSAVENWASTSLRGFSFDDEAPIQSQQKSRRRSRTGLNSRQSPALKGKEAVVALGSTYDEGVGFELDLGSPVLGPTATQGSLPRNLSIGSPPSEVWYDARGKALTPTTSLRPEVSSKPQTPISPGLRDSTSPQSSTSAANAGAPWGTSPAVSKKLDLADIMQQTSASRVSNLSAGLAASKSNPEAGTQVNLGSKLSQKDRKKLQQQAMQSPKQLPVLDTKSLKAGTPPTTSSPWQVINSSSKRPSLREMMSTESFPSPSPVSSKSGADRATNTPQLTMRQTVAGSKSPSPLPDPPLQTPRVPKVNTARPVPSAVKSSPTVTTSPTSIRHQPRPVSPSLQLSMADILSQQQAEKDIIAKVREDNAKRSLQDIQREQEFQEWWAKEERRHQIENGLLPPGESEGSDLKSGKATKGGKKASSASANSRAKAGGGRGEQHSKKGAKLRPAGAASKGSSDHAPADGKGQSQQLSGRGRGGASGGGGRGSGPAAAAL